MENQEYGPVVQRMLEYIENHISEHHLEDACGCRMVFTLALRPYVQGSHRSAPFTFIRRLRLTKAAK